MKLTPWLLAVSLAANGLLVWKVLSFPAGRSALATEAVASSSPAGLAGAASARPAVAVLPPAVPRAAMPPLGAKEMRADDFRALAARLREEGFPEAAVRQIIVSVLNQHYEEVGYATIRPKIDPADYWRSPVVRSTPEGIAARNRLEEEMKATLVAVFGPEAEMSEDRARRLFHGISPESVTKMKKIFADYTEMEKQAREQAKMPAELPMRLDMLNRERQADLERALTPEEFRLYELRNGAAASRLRNYFGEFQVTEAEFLAVYPAAQAVEAQQDEYRGREGRQREFARFEAEARRVFGEERFAAFMKTKRQ